VGTRRGGEEKGIVVRPNSASKSTAKPTLAPLASAKHDGIEFG